MWDRLYKQLPIRRKLALNIALLCMGLVFAVMSAVAWLDYQRLKQNLLDQAQTIALIIGKNATPALVFEDPQGAEDVLHSLLEHPDIAAAAIYTRQGHAFADLLKPGVQTVLPMSLDENSPDVEFSDDFLRMHRLISFEGQTLGYVWLELSLEHLHARQAQYIAGFSAALLFTMVVASILASRIHRVFSKPLQQLLGVSRKVSQEQAYHLRIEHQREDEMGVLMDAYNSMLEAVSERDLRLTEHSEELEKLVQLRSKQLHQRAYYDDLTKLPNRHLLLDRLKQAISSARREGHQLAILFLDLDRFKIVNDNLGHLVGDHLLIAVAKRLRQLLREDDTVSRLGGDEFVIILRNIKQASDATRVADNIIECLQEPFQLLDHTLHTSTSIGIALFPGDGEDTDTLLQRADASMYHAKRQGVGLSAFYEPRFERHSKQRLDLENKLREALENDHCHLVYQPQHCAQTGHLVGFEALMRWHHDTDGPISPGVFIPIAEEIGVINQVGIWALHETCRLIQRIETFHQGHNLKVSINFSAKHLMEANFFSEIASILAQYAVRPESLQIEITEDTFLHGSEGIMRQLQRLKEMGIAIAIDDFGTGYSSLNYLRTFPIDTLKLDGCFIQDLEKDEASRGIVASTITLGHSLGLSLVAECVETQGQVDFLKKHHCDIIQGYLFSAPIAEEKVEAYINKYALLNGDEQCTRHS